MQLEPAVRACDTALAVALSRAPVDRDTRARDRFARAPTYHTAHPTPLPDIRRMILVQARVVEFGPLKEIAARLRSHLNIGPS